MIIAVIGIYLGTIVISEIKCISLVARIKNDLQKQNFSLKKDINYEIKNNICSSLDLFILGFNLHKINHFIKDYHKNYERCKIKLLYDKKIIHNGAYINTNLRGYENDMQNQNKIKIYSIDADEKMQNKTRADLIKKREILLQSLVNPVVPTYNEEQDNDDTRKR